MKNLPLLALVMLVWGCAPASLDSFFYAPVTTDDYKLSTAIIPRFEERTTTTVDGVTLHYIFVPGTNAVTLIYCHGQGGDISDSWPRIELLSPLGYNLVIFDYRGFGRSSGSPTESGIVVDEQTLYDAVVTTTGADARKLVYYGRSFGGATCIDLATHKPPAVLVEESTFTSVDALVHDGAYVDLPRTFIARSKWDSLGKMALLGGVPFLAMHGLADYYVQPKYSMQLAAAHSGTTKLLLVDGADHGSVPDKLGIDTYLQTVDQFVRAAITLP
jgi:pimeloyl-ACP methyl ester carboxylesterase